jgi:hypothetical protein
VHVVRTKKWVMGLQIALQKNGLQQTKTEIKIRLAILDRVVQL